MKKLFVASLLVLFSLASCTSEQSAADRSSVKDSSKTEVSSIPKNEPEKSDKSKEKPSYSVSLDLDKGRPEITKESLEKKENRTGYSMGFDMGRQIREYELNLNLDAFMKGFADSINGHEPLIDRKEMIDALRKMSMEIGETQKKKQQANAQENKRKGAEFLKKNAKEEGVVVHPSGLQYKILHEGTGKKPNSKDTVVVDFIGTTLDGTEFSNSYKTGKPVTFEVRRAVPGWANVLPLIKKGTRFQLFLPPELGYGPSPLGRIGANSTLIFEMELLDINPAKNKKTAGKSAK